MTAVDPQFQQHRQTWLAFTRLIKYALAIIIIILIGLAYFTL
jgi:hypothetical protein